MHVVTIELATPKVWNVLPTIDTAGEIDMRIVASRCGTVSECVSTLDQEAFRLEYL